MNCPICGSTGETLLSTFVCQNADCQNYPGHPSAELRMLHDRVDTRHMLEEPDEKTVSAELNEQLWRKGVLYHLLNKSQQEIYDHWYGLPPSVRIAVSMIARRFGKTFTYGCIAIEKALRQPGSIQHYFAMTTVQVRNMLIPVFQQILQSCPPDIAPRLLQRDSSWVFDHNGSKIMMLGAEDQQKCDRARGQHSDGAFGDEAGYIPCLNYLVNSVVMPMLQGRPGARMTLYSNAPFSPAHDIVPFINNAKAAGAYLHRTVYDSPRYSAQEIEEFAEGAGGKDSAIWQREYLAQIVVDEDHAVIPEWQSREDRLWVLDPDSFRALVPGPEHAESDIRQPLVREVERPEYFDIYTSMDLGFAPDLTSILTGYWDYLEARLVVEDERELSKATTDKVAEAAEDMEQSQWSSYWDFQEANHGKAKRPYMRIMDVNKQMQADLSGLHGMQFLDANNKDLDSQINRLRQGVRHGKIVIHPRCKNLINHLRAAYWDNSRKSFARPSKAPRPGDVYYGHFDHLSALQLMWAHIVRSHDPYPEIPLGISRDTHHISPKARHRRSKPDGIEQLARSMKARRFKHRRYA